MNRKNITQMLLALFLILGGVALVGTQLFGWELRFFAGWWTLPFVAAAIALMVRFGPRIYSCLLLGGALLTLARAQGFLLETRVQYWAAMGALLLISLGVMILLRILRPQKPKTWQPPPEPPREYQATVTVEATSNAQEKQTHD